MPTVEFSDAHCTNWSPRAILLMDLLITAPGRMSPPATTWHTSWAHLEVRRATAALPSTFVIIGQSLDRWVNSADFEIILGKLKCPL